jgi:FKBP-type peptidyl-prolyl cis-trans isomerase SlyD
MADSTIVTRNKVVTISYTLKDSAGKELDRSEPGQPLPYLHGHGNIVPGLEAGLEGKSAGESVLVVVPPSEGYGEKEGPGPQPVPRAAFPPDAEIEVGDNFATENEEGHTVPVWVAKIEEDTIYIDFDHPLAGEHLHFDVTIEEIRDATKEELQHGHVHGPHGHHHH